MNQKNKRMQLILTKTALRVLNEQELQLVGGRDNGNVILTEPISMVWVTNNTTMTKVPPSGGDDTLVSSRCDTATESSRCDTALPFASNP